MATLQELKDKWITDYIPSQADYEELFDFIIQSSPIKSFTDSFELGNFTTETPGPTTDKAVVDIALAPGENKVNVLNEIYVAAKVTGAYSITSINTGSNTISFDIYAGDSRISTQILEMQDLAFAPVVLEFDIDYGGQIGNFTNQPISIEIVGQGIDHSQDNSGKLELKYSATYEQVDAFPFAQNPGNGVIIGGEEVVIGGSLPGGSLNKI